MIDLRSAGDRGIHVVLSAAGVPDPATILRTRELAARLRAAAIPGVTECVPGYESVLVVYDGVAVNPAAVRAAVAACAVAPASAPARVRATVSPTPVPVCVCPACALDRDEAVARLGRPWPAIVAAFCAAPYAVWLRGFQPGFPFLGPLPAGLALPRLPSPRPRVPAGSVGIGGMQAGIYATSGPGGWRILGRTNLVLFDPRRNPPVLFTPGAAVRFEPGEDHAAFHFAER